MVLKQTAYEFSVVVKHPLPDKAEYQIKVMRELTYNLAAMIKDAKFHNGTTQITPVVKKRTPTKKRTIKKSIQETT